MLLGRRRFLVGSLGAAAALSGAGRSAAAVAAHRLSFYHIHTAEKLTIVYREKGVLIPEALVEINRYLRDFRTEQIHDIDVALLDTLHALYSTFDERGNFEVISGYRSPHTNAALAARDDRRRREQPPHSGARDRRAPDQRQDH